MKKFWKRVGIVLLVSVATLGIGLIIWGIWALIKKAWD